jgi:hypothetical protein
MRLRGVSKSDVAAIVRNPYFSVPSHFGRLIVVKKYGDKYLKAVCEKSNDKITVVTVYWTRRP